MCMRESSVIIFSLGASSKDNEWEQMRRQLGPVSE